MSTLSLDGRVAIITGAGSGIGAAVATGLADLGVSVVVNDLSTDVRGTQIRGDSAIDLAHTICERGGMAMPDRSSVADLVQMSEMVDATMQRFGRLDLLLNFAGITRTLPLCDCGVADWDAVVEVHLGGHLNCIQAVLAVMEPAGFGRIINVTSGAGLMRASAGNAAYGTAKRAIAALTWTMGRRLPPGVTVHAISPVASTRMTEEARVARAQANTSGVLSLDDLPSPRSLIPLVAYLCSGDGERDNGRVFFTNGRQVSVIDEPRLVQVVDVLPRWSSGEAAAALAKDLLFPAVLEGHRGGDSNSPLDVRGDDTVDAGRSPTEVQIHDGMCVLIQDLENEESEIRRSLVSEGWTVQCLRVPMCDSSEPIKRSDIFAETSALLHERIAQAGSPDAIVISSCGSRDTEDAMTGSRVPKGSQLSRTLRFHAACTRAALSLSSSGLTVLNVARTEPASTPSESVLGQALAQFTRIVQSGCRVQETRLYCVLIDQEIAATGRNNVAEFLAFLWVQDEAGALSGRAFEVGAGWIGMQSQPTIGVTVSTERAEWSLEDLERVLPRAMSERQDAGGPRMAPQS